jgi:hypothetical protein
MGVLKKIKKLSSIYYINKKLFSLFKKKIMKINKKYGTYSCEIIKDALNYYCICKIFFGTVNYSKI